MLAAVDMDFGARDIGGRRIAKEVDGCGNFFGAPQPTERDILDHFLCAGRQN